MGAASLSTLPKELKLSVAELLSPAPDLIAVAGTCKCLRQVVEPLIYRSIRLQLDENCHDPPVGLLLRTLLERPELASYTRDLNLDGHYYDSKWNPRKDPLPTRVHQPGDRLWDAVSSVGLPLEAARNWPLEIGSGNPDATAALIIALSSNLTSLRVDNNWASQTTYLGHILEVAARNTLMNKTAIRHTQIEQKAVLRSLERVEIVQLHWGPPIKSPQSIDNDLCLFYLPQLQHMSSPLVNPVKFSWPFDSKPRPSTLTVLELTRIRECLLEDILLVAANLQKLRYSWLLKEDVDGHVNKRVVDLDTMARAFGVRKDTLRELEVEARTLPAYGIGELDPPDIFLRGSLRKVNELTHLRRLELPWEFIVGAREVAPTGTISSVLPPNIEQVTLSSGLEFDTDDLVEWSDKTYVPYVREEYESGALAAFPNLTRFALPGPNFHGATPETVKEMECLSSQSSITFTHAGNPWRRKADERKRRLARSR